MVIGKIRFLASTVAPKPEEVEYWIDIKDNPYGCTVKCYDGKEWNRIDLKSIDAIEAAIKFIKELSKKFDEILFEFNTQSKLIEVLREKILNHIDNIDNPHSVTKEQVGLDNVTNDAQVKRSEMGVAEGVATLDALGKVPSEQLPSYVDDVLDGTYVSETVFNNTDGTPYELATSVIYIDIVTNKTYRYSGTKLIEITSSSLYADEEDIHETENGKLLFADREYDSELYSGMGKKILRKNTYYTILDISSITDYLNIHEISDAKDITLELGTGTINTMFKIVANTTLNKIYAECTIDGVTHYYTKWNSSYTYCKDDGTPVTNVLYRLYLNKERMTSTVLAYSSNKLINYLSLEESPKITVPVLNQNDFDTPNTVYEIRYEFWLAGETINMPENCVLLFNGGILHDGYILNRVIIKNISDNLCIGNNISFENTNKWLNVLWFGLNNTASKINDEPFKNMLDTVVNNGGGTIYFPNGEYIFQDTVFYDNYHIPWNTAIISSTKHGLYNVKIVGENKENTILRGTSFTFGSGQSSFRLRFSYSDIGIGCMQYNDCYMGDNSITVVKPELLENISIGDTVFICNGYHYVMQQPYGELNLVTGIDTKTGTIYLKNPLSMDYVLDYAPMFLHTVLDFVQPAEGETVDVVINGNTDLTSIFGQLLSIGRSVYLPISIKQTDSNYTITLLNISGISNVEAGTTINANTPVGGARYITTSYGFDHFELHNITFTNVIHNTIVDNTTMTGNVIRLLRFNSCYGGIIDNCDFVIDELTATDTNCALYFIDMGTNLIFNNCNFMVPKTGVKVSHLHSRSSSRNTFINCKFVNYWLDNSEYARLYKFEHCDFIDTNVSLGMTTDMFTFMYCTFSGGNSAGMFGGGDIQNLRKVLKHWHKVDNCVFNIKLRTSISVPSYFTNNTINCNDFSCRLLIHNNADATQFVYTTGTVVYNICNNSIYNNSMYEGILYIDNLSEIVDVNVNMSNLYVTGTNSNSIVNTAIDINNSSNKSLSVAMSDICMKNISYSYKAGLLKISDNTNLTINNLYLTDMTGNYHVGYNEYLNTSIQNDIILHEVINNKDVINRIAKDDIDSDLLAYEEMHHTYNSYLTEAERNALYDFIRDLYRTNLRSKMKYVVPFLGSELKAVPIPLFIYNELDAIESLTAHYRLPSNLNMLYDKNIGIFSDNPVAVINFGPLSSKILSGDNIGMFTYITRNPINSYLTTIPVNYEKLCIKCSNTGIYALINGTTFDNVNTSNIIGLSYVDTFNNTYTWAHNGKSQNYTVKQGENLTLSYETVNLVFATGPTNIYNLTPESNGRYNGYGTGITGLTEHLSYEELLVFNAICNKFMKALGRPTAGNVVSIAESGTSKDRPAYPTINYRYFNTDTNSIEIWDGSDWRNEDGTLVNKVTIL